jgi:hypothetical protein
MDTSKMEQVTLTVVSNDGDTAICTVMINGKIVDTAKFEREEENRHDFQNGLLAVGSQQVGGRIEADDDTFEDMKQEAYKTRVPTKSPRCNGNNS